MTEVLQLRVLRISATLFGNRGLCDLPPRRHQAGRRKEHHSEELWEGGERVPQMGVVLLRAQKGQQAIRREPGPYAQLTFAAFVAVAA